MGKINQKEESGQLTISAYDSKNRGIGDWPIWMSRVQNTKEGMKRRKKGHAYGINGRKLDE